MLRDAIVLGALHPAVLEKCLENRDELTLEGAIALGQSYEVSQNSLKVISQTTKGASVDAVSARKNTCYKCGTQHTLKRGTCPPKDSKCSKCGKKWTQASECGGSKFRPRKPSKASGS